MINSLLLLKQMQELPLIDKVLYSKQYIAQYHKYFYGDVYVQFSGGKDSIVLLDLCRELYPDMLAAYCDNGLDYPDCKELAYNTENISIIRPEITFKEFINKYGWTYPNRITALKVELAKKNYKSALLQLKGLGVDGEYSPYNQRYKSFYHLVNAPFNISGRCCDIMLEKPFQEFRRRSKRVPISGNMACDSYSIKLTWKNVGVNTYHKLKAKSYPLIFWTEQDILQYILEHNLVLPKVYGDIVSVDGKLSTTGVKHTDCLYCLLKIHKRHNKRFIELKKTCPEAYEYCMHDLGMGKILNYIGIKY